MQKCDNNKPNFFNNFYFFYITKLTAYKLGQISHGFRQIPFILRVNNILFLKNFVERHP